MSAGKPVCPNINYDGFPLLNEKNHRKTSEADSYNCLAWAAGYNDRHWWPGLMADGTWPICWQEVSIDCFVRAYEFIDYEICQSPDLEAGFEKIAIYAKPDGEPTHAARQLPNGRWTSKMGVGGEDIEHDWGVLDGPRYGSVVRIMRRRTGQPTPAPQAPQAAPTD
jgi:hypothetical protein